MVVGQVGCSGNSGMFAVDSELCWAPPGLGTSMHPSGTHHVDHSYVQ
jgi:hypothetical protein